MATQGHSAEISVVIPVFMSGRSLHELYARLKTVLDSIAMDWEIIMVDDGSGDDTYEVMHCLRTTDRRVKIIRLARNYGQQTATLCGLRQASGAYVVTIDDDLQHPPEEIPRILGKLREGFDVVLGKYTEKMHSPVRNLSSRIADCTSKVLLGKPEGLYCSSFRGFSRKAAETVAKFRGTKPFVTALILRSVPISSIVNVEVRHNSRLNGRSGYTLRKLVRLFFSLLMMQRLIPFEKLALLGALLVGLSLLEGLFLRNAFAGKAMVMAWILFAALLVPGIIMLVWGAAGCAKSREGCSQQDADTEMIVEQEG